MLNQFIQFGGVRFDTINATWPFAKIIVNAQMIEIKVFWKRYTLHRNDIIGLRKYQGLLSNGIIIEHSKTDLSNHIVFWSIDFEKLKQGLENLGFVVGDQKKSDNLWTWRS